MTDITTSLASLKKPGGFSRWVVFLIGFLAGAAIASTVFLLVLRIQQDRQKALEINRDVNPLKHIQDGFLNPGKAEGGPKPTTEEATILENGKGLIADLEQNRLTSVYRSTTPGFQLNHPRKSFDMMVERFPTLTRLIQFDNNRVYKVKKTPGKDGYDFYFTGKPLDFPNQFLNVWIHFIQTEDGWLAEEMEITSNDKN